MTVNQAETAILSTRVTGASTPSFVPLPSERFYIPLRAADKINPRFLVETDDSLLRWYPMRIRYSREKRACDIRDELTSLGYSTYLHIQPQEYLHGRKLPQTSPSLFNIIFVQAMKVQLKLLKQFSRPCSSMQFWHVKPLDPQEQTRILWIPDRQMQAFIDSATRPDPYNQRIPLTYSDFIDKQDRRVRILCGPFAGVEGEVKRIGHRRIVVSLLRDTQTAIGICNVAPEHLQLL